MADTTTPQSPWYKQTLQRSTYSLSFTTPAFLGDAEQLGNWRTPPIKALLRFWWRIASWPSMNGDVARLRTTEKALFGGVGQNGEERNAAQRSLVQLRLNSWEEGKLNNSNWPTLHLDILKNANNGNVRADAYLGYGPILPKLIAEIASARITRDALSPLQKTELTVTHAKNEQLADALQLPVQDVRLPSDALALMQWFGTLGSRSVNGWGSIQITDSSIPALPTANSPVLTSVTSSLEDCLVEDWPHAIGKDGKGPLIWTSQINLPSWQRAISYLGQLKIDLRTKAKQHRFSAKPYTMAGVHLLGYPAGPQRDIKNKKNGEITTPKSIWTIDAWKKQGNTPEVRIASQLRFKVIRNSENTFTCLIYHLPHSLPDFAVRRLEPLQQKWLKDNQLKVWQKLHELLDNTSGLARLSSHQGAN
ncbi:hypothetical protein WH50_17770 [Pokkaliibacter plantistimulans]|uniref:CRISPR-associated protein Cmr1 n=1 Tax=Pokkaliibacter plantistimulans TaxID=1635171 RepID=A0ABX5LTI8_9GAMM|nr:hypothetical protein [Pokkaliibacter plantistimulans]PXF29967.1 hypothetical protein WH50_17770 [Pokkaliibacter plantistimulans]